MTSGETDDGRDGKVIGAYRAASTALDERASPAARAAILAAAARAVDAQPSDASTGATSSRRSAGKRAGLAPSRRPLALVASFLVASVAIVLATRVERETPDVAEAPAARSTTPREQAAPAPAMTDATAPLKPEAETRQSVVSPGDATTAKRVRAPDPVEADTARLAEGNPRMKTNPDVPARADGATAATGPKVEAPAAPPPAAAAEQALSKLAAADARTESPSAPAAPPASSTPGANGTLALTPETAPRRMAESGALAQRATQGDAQFSAKPALQPAPPSTDELRARRAPTPAGLANEPAVVSQMARARPVERTAPIDSETENDPARWLKRIVSLRETGLDEQADRELARLRERYPQVEVPPNALRRAGTR